MKISFEQLLVILDDLDLTFIKGRMSWKKYHSEWMGMLAAAGYTIDEYLKALDNRWDEEIQVAKPLAMV